MLEDPEHRAMMKRLLREYPHLDQMMAETLVWAYFSNALNKDNVESEIHPPKQCNDIPPKGTSECAA